MNAARFFPSGRSAALGMLLSILMAATSWSGAAAQAPGLTRLPDPRRESRLSVEQAMQSRRSIRDFQAAPLTLGEVSQLLWAAQGVTGPGGRRTTPSAGALHPLTIHLVAGAVAGLAPGVYRYEPQGHALAKVGDGDRRAALAGAAGQRWIAGAAAVLVIAADVRRTTRKYGARGRRYVDIEAGHVAQNVYLQAAALGLGVTDVGAFDDRKIKALAALPSAAEPVLIVPVGRPRP